jgi:hypothetical protein
MQAAYEAEGSGATAAATLSATWNVAGFVYISFALHAVTVRGRVLRRHFGGMMGIMRRCRVFTVSVVCVCL